MTTDTQTAHDDLAFLRRVAEGDRTQSLFGALYFWAGLIYGLQLLFHWGQAIGVLRVSEGVTIAAAAGPTAIFLVILGVLIWRNRRKGVGGVAGRAVASVFNAVGITNLALVAIIGSLAWREMSWDIWMIYPAVVFALQGAAWLAAFTLRRRAWLASVAAGWFGAAIAMGLLIGSPSYLLVAAFGAFLFMALPGAVMMRLARTER